MKRYLAFAALWCAASYAVATPKIEFSEVEVASAKRIVLFVGEDLKLENSAEKVDQLTENGLAKALENADFDGESGSTQSFYGLSPFTQVVVVGTGDEILTAAKLQDLGGYAAAKLPANGEQQAVILTDNLVSEVATPASWIATGAGLRDYHFDKYKKASAQTTSRDLLIQSQNVAAAQAKYNEDLHHLVKGVYLARDMASEPGKSIYPQKFVEEVRAAFKGVKNVDIDVLDVGDMKKHSMGALLGVGQGSIHDPRLLVINYQGADSDEAPYAFVGKGITFDTGGISLS